MDHAIKFWDRLAPRYAKSPIKNMDSYNYTLNRTRSYLGENDQVLEIGAGTGTTALDLAGNVKHITATDISPAMIEIGREKAWNQGIANVEFVATPATAPDLNGPYDAVLAHNILHLVDDLPAVLGRANAVLKPGGLFISKTFCKPTSLSPFFLLMRVVLPVMQLFGKAPFVALLTEAELIEAMEAKGFDVIETDTGPNGEMRKYIVARKR